ncbi:MAG: sugar ABC transporter substrate-binding protein [Caldilinea sp. CFX5]|nr:sugar ABC transporter substrate-binding protein [Caldilinea sp. CFX5]
MPLLTPAFTNRSKAFSLFLAPRRLRRLQTITPPVGASPCGRPAVGRPQGDAPTGNLSLWNSLKSLLLVSFLLLLTTGCERPALPALPQWLPQLWGAPPTPTPVPITTELRLATWPASSAIDTYFQQRVAAYQERAPGTQITLQVLPDYGTRLRTLLENEAPPDVVRLNAFLLPDLVERGLLAPLPAALSEQADLPPLLQQMSEVDGTPYCLPHAADTLALLYNRAYFDAAQLAYPTADWTWETLRTTAEQLTDVNTGRYGLVLPADFSRWLPFLYGAGGTVTDSTAISMTINSPAGLTALEFYSNLVLDGMAATPVGLGNAWAGEAFAQEHAAMSLEGNWMIPYLAETAPTLTYGVAPLPVGPTGQATLAFVNCYAISAGAADRTAAVALIEFLTDDESQRQWFALTAALPARAVLLPDWTLAYPAQAAFGQGLAYSYPWQLPPNFQPVVDGMNDGIQRIFGGFALADTVLAEAEATGNKRLQR